MKIVVKRTELKKALTKVSQAVDAGKSSLPVLKGVLIEGEGKSLKLTATDLSNKIELEVNAEIIEAGKSVVPYKKFKEIVSRLKSENVELSLSDKFYVKDNDSEFSLIPFSAEDFPLPVKLSALWSITLNAKELNYAFKRIHKCISLDDCRKILHGVLFTPNERNVDLVVTDGRKLAIYPQKPIKQKGKIQDAVLAYSGVRSFISIFKEDKPVKISFGLNYAIIESEKIRFITTVLNGNYPNYKQVIPAEFKRRLSIPKDEMQEKIKLARVCGCASETLLKWQEKKLHIESKEFDLGFGMVFRDSIRVAENPNESFQISFFLNMLDTPFELSRDKAVLMEFNDQHSPIIFSDYDMKYLMMPRRTGR